MAEQTAGQSKDSPRCSVVIRAFNEERHLGRLLRGIQQQGMDDVEVILVDSGSSDATLTIAREFGVQVLRIEPQSFTFGRSLNLGCRHARGEAIVVASAHVYPVYPDWLERLLEPFQDPGVALVYGRQRGNSTTHFSEQQQFAKLYPEVSLRAQEGAFCNNANAAVRRSLWVQRAYDEELPGLEDLEWAMWARNQGHSIAYVAEAEVVHVHEETPGQVYNRYRREAIALKRLRPHEHFGLADFLRLYGSNLLSDLWHARRSRQLGRRWREIVWFRLMQFWGTYRGFAHRGPLSAALKRTFYYPRGLTSAVADQARPVEPIDYSALTGKVEER